MRRLARRLFTLCSAVSLLLIVVVAFLWLRGYDGRDTLWLSLGHDRPLIGIASQRGTLTLVAHERYGWPAGLRLRFGEAPRSAPRDNMRRVRGDLRWQGMGFDIQRSYHWRTWLLALPNWSVLAVSAAFPLLAVARSKRWSRRPGRCPSCGYDLRASPGRCPECGAVALPERV